MEEQQIDQMRQDLTLEHKDFGIEVYRHSSICWYLTQTPVDI